MDVRADTEVNVHRVCPQAYAMDVHRFARADDRVRRRPARLPPLGALAAHHAKRSRQAAALSARGRPPA
jgi:hypothetical protein